LFLASEGAPSRVILGAGAGVFAVTRIEETQGVYLDDAERSPETIAARWDEISRAESFPLEDALYQTRKFARLARLARKGASSRGSSKTPTATSRSAP
jgi:hypothetical protein